MNMISAIDAEIARVRAAIGELETEAAELETARRVLERLGGGEACVELALTSEPDACLGTSASQSARSSWQAELTAQATGTLTNVGAIDISSHAGGSRECRPVGTEEPAAEAETTPEPPAKPAKKNVISRGRPASNEPAAPLVAEIEAFLALGVYKPTRFDRDCLKSPTALPRLRKPGATVKPSTAARIRAWMAERSPAPEAPPSPAPHDDTCARPEPAAAAAPTGARLDDVEVGDIIGEIREFLKRNGMTPARFGREAVRDPKFVNGLNKRSAVRGKTAARVRAFIAEWVPPVEQPNPPPAPERRLPALPRHRDPATYQARQAQAARGVNRREAEKLLARDPQATHGRNGGITHAILEIRHQQASEVRQADPVEQAKLALQRKGRVVHSASLHGGRADRFHVSGQRDGNGRLLELTRAEILDLAERVTGQSFRRVG